MICFFWISILEIITVSLKINNNLNQIISAINILYQEGKINDAIRLSALRLIISVYDYTHPPTRLLSIGQMLLILGLLILFTIVSASYSFMSLLFIQLCIISCVVKAYHHSSLRNKLLYIASFLVGLFIWLFAKYYQATNIPSYYFGLLWLTLILGWTLISNYTAQWLLSLLIANGTLILWHAQDVSSSPEMKHMIFAYLTLLNGAALVIPEYFLQKKDLYWLKSWPREFIADVIMLSALAPILTWAFRAEAITVSLQLSFFISLLAHILTYYYFRYQSLNIKPLKTIVFSSCIILNIIAYKVLLELLSESHEAKILLLGSITIAIFTTGLRHLQKINSPLKNQNA
jgi:hypothetical protein